MSEPCHHIWARVRGIPGTRSFEICCITCGKEALEIRPKVAPLTEWGWIARTYEEFVRSLEEEEAELESEEAR